MVATRNRKKELVHNIRALTMLPERPPIFPVGNGSEDGSADALAGLDPVCAQMSRAVLGTEPDLPGPSILGFVAYGTAVRRSAFLEVSGFSPILGFGGEEQLLAVDLAAGWGLSCIPSGWRATSGRLHRCRRCQPIGDRSPTRLNAAFACSLLRPRASPAWRSVVQRTNRG